MKNKIIIFFFIFIIIVFPITSLIVKDRDISKYERRKLTTTKQLKNNFLDNLDKYLTDQFPLRDKLISLNSIFERYILNNIDSKDIYIKDGYLIEKNYPLEEKSVNSFINKINHINKKYLSNSNTYYMNIPDKGYFLDDDKYLKIDYQYISKRLSDEIDMDYIDTTKILKLDDYYKTDIHLKQDSYFKVIEELNKYLELDYSREEYIENEYNKFYGSSYSKVPMYIKPDKLTYLTNKITENVKVTHLEYGNKQVYDIEKLDKIDSYNVFLSGPSAFIEIKNEKTTNDKELIVFRDSFSSSLVPLLIPYYKKITLIDLRYIRDDIAAEMIDFNNKDVLFVFSTLIVNKSNLLKVNN